MTPLRARLFRRKFLVLFILVAVAVYARQKIFGPIFVVRSHSDLIPAVIDEDDVTEDEPILPPVRPQPPVCPTQVQDDQDSPEDDSPFTPVPHTYGSDGLLTVSPNSDKHPILELIQRAESEWQSKLDRASKTLDEAVAEYKRRYGRKPPLGFDDW
jgi:hypothetical protein